MFENVFKKFHEKNSEVKLIGVWGKDGLELEKQFFSQLGELDLELTGAELADIISKLCGMKSTPDKYFIKLNFHGFQLLVFSLNTDFFLMVVAENHVVPGKLNFYVNMYRSELLSSL